MACAPKGILTALGASFLISADRPGEDASPMRVRGAIPPVRDTIFGSPRMRRRGPIVTIAGLFCRNPGFRQGGKPSRRCEAWPSPPAPGALEGYTAASDGFA